MSIRNIGRGLKEAILHVSPFWNVWRKKPKGFPDLMKAADQHQLLEQKPVEFPDYMGVLVAGNQGESPTKDRIVLKNPADIPKDEFFNGMMKAASTMSAAQRSSVRHLIIKGQREFTDTEALADAINAVAQEPKLDKNGLPVVTPEDILGADYGPEKVVWAHEDDMFIEFYDIPGMAVLDLEFFNRYMTNTLLEKEKEAYPYHIVPCFIEGEHFVNSIMGSPLKATSEDEEQYCCIVLFQKVLGLLLISADDHVDIVRRTYGLDPKNTDMHYHIQFMRFDQRVIERLDVSGIVNDWYLYKKSHTTPLRVNFARFQHQEMKDES